MKIPTIVCDACGSHSVRLASYNGIGERVRGILGIQPFRCRECKHRFLVSIWLFDKMAYAKCPKCLRMDLVYWSKKYYKPNPWTNFLISLGAQRYRCSACRCNFVSFRPLKKFEEPEEIEQETPAVLAPESTASEANVIDPVRATTAELAHVADEETLVENAKKTA